MMQKNSGGKPSAVFCTWRKIFDFSAKRLAVCCGRELCKALGAHIKIAEEKPSAIFCRHIQNPGECYRFLPTSSMEKPPCRTR